MRKWIALIAVVFVAGWLALPVEATVNVIPGPNEAHLKDVSHHFVGSIPGIPTSGTPVPLGYQLQGGEELRSVLRVDDLEVMGSSTGKYWFHKTTTGDEVTGIFYDIVLTRVDAATGALYYSPLTRNPLTVGDDTDGDIVGFGGAWGGVIELYQDPTPDLDLAMLAGSPPSAWQPGAGPASRATGTTADGYPTATDGSLWLSGVLLDLSVFGAGLPGEVYVLTPVPGLSGKYSGLAFMNVFDGYAAGSIDPKLPLTGPGAGLADVIIQNTVSLGVNVWNNPTWEAGSSDPMRFDVVPEPTIMLLFGASIVGGLIRRKF